MNIDRINSLVREFQPDQASIVREFAQRPMDEQLVYLFVGQQQSQQDRKRIVADIAELQEKKSLKDKLHDIGIAGAFVSYILFDHKDNLPWFKG